MLHSNENAKELTWREHKVLESTDDNQAKKKPLRSYGDKRPEGLGKESRRFLKDFEENWVLAGCEACQSVSLITVMRIRKNLPSVITNSECPGMRGRR